MMTPVLSKLAHAFRPWGLMWVSMVLYCVGFSSLSLLVFSFIALLLLRARVFAGKRKERVILVCVPCVQRTPRLFSKLV